VAVVRALAVLQIEDVGQTFFRVILGTNIFLFQRTVGSRALARIVHPSHQVIEIRFLSNAGKIRGESATLHLIAFANGMAGHTASRLKQFFTVFGVSRILLG